MFVETLQGKEYEIVVQSISLRSIQGIQIEIPIEDIKSIEKEKPSVNKTMFLVEIGLFFIALLSVVGLGGGI